LRGTQNYLPDEIIRPDETRARKQIRAHPSPNSWSLRDVSSIVAVVAGIAATIKVFIEVRRACEQRKDELIQRTEELSQRKREFRHKQTESKARDALKMLDWLKASYKNTDEVILSISRSQFQDAMRTSSPNGPTIIFTPSDKFFRLVPLRLSGAIGEFDSARANQIRRY
jgi:hypothetical protein